MFSAVCSDLPNEFLVYLRPNGTPSILNSQEILLVA